MSKHQNLTGASIHVPHAWTYADATARAAATGFTASDVGKLALQSDTGAYWRLTATTPTWVQQTGAGGLTVREVDTSPSVAASILEFPNGTLADQGGGVARYTPAAAGGDSTTTAAYASRPAASNDGDVFYPSDGFVIERDTGAAYAPWGPIYPLTPPVLADFTWHNQQTATATQAGGGIYLYAPAVSGDAARVLYKAAPATPYTLTVGYIPHMYAQNYPAIGIGFRQSSDGKMHVWASKRADRYTVASEKYNSATSYNNAYSYTEVYTAGLVWMRIQDNGTSRICSWSSDGQNFYAFHTVGRTDFLTADQIFFFATSVNGTYPVAMTLLSWKVT